MFVFAATLVPLVAACDWAFAAMCSLAAIIAWASAFSAVSWYRLPHAVTVQPCCGSRLERDLATVIANWGGVSNLVQRLMSDRWPVRA